MPATSARFRLDLRRMIIPASLGMLTVLAFGTQAPAWLILAAAAIVPSGYGLAAWYVHRELPEFEKEFAALAPRGDAAALWRLFEDYRLLLFLTPSWVMLAKRGMVYGVEGNHRAANAALEEAYVRAPKHRRADLLGPLTRTKYALGDVVAMRDLATQWRTRALFPGSASIYLAAAYLADPREDPEDARSLLEEIRVGLDTEEQALRSDLLDQIAARTT